MSWYLRRTSEPGVEPLTLDEVKTHCRVDYNDEDLLLSGYITAAREIVENETSRALVTQSWELGLDDFPVLEDTIRIPRGSLQSIDTFTYEDTNGNLTNMVAGQDYILKQYAEPAELVLPWNGLWPAVVLQSGGAVKINFTCGYGNETDVPVALKHAMLMLIADWNENREDTVIGRTSQVAVRMPSGIDRLLFNYRLRNYSPFQN